MPSFRLSIMMRRRYAMSGNRMAVTLADGDIAAQPQHIKPSERYFENRSPRQPFTDDAGA